MDDYALAAANYEMAVLAWFEAGDRDCWPRGDGITTGAEGREVGAGDGTTGAVDGKCEAGDRDCRPRGDGTTDPVKAYRAKKVDEAQAWLDVVVRWEAFVLDARFGMRIQTGLEVLKWFRKKFPP